ncbi:hypothetical protein C7S16_5563 [Burkholderia thailandensis]|uniref:Uncharacterized protein n=1 Tax=Burkholderia thailandensis TaxID=57975 RepID=A0AAW9CPP4_BURTH|nr:hypothetical protein [Burkholderia thailandensis]MDW9252600.1 hypothetical protein [Burkholderia thailandensis]
MLTPRRAARPSRSGPRCIATATAATARPYARRIACANASRRHAEERSAPKTECRLDSPPLRR